MPGIGVIGTGDIAPRYVAGIAAADGLDLVAVASRSPDRAATLAARFGTQACSREALIASPAVDIIVNLAAPLDHAAITHAALKAGKHVYCEKPLAASVAEGAALLACADAMKRLLAVAPATTMGPRQQQARRLLADGTLGQVVGASASIVYPGPDLWHHNPAALFGPAAGPLFDMAVYDIATLVDLLGPISSVAAFGRQLSGQRIIQQGPAAGNSFPVQIPTHIVALLQFGEGPLATLTCSFDGFGSAAAGVELIGTQGSVRIGHSSRFSGDFSISTRLGAWEAMAAEPDDWSEDLWIIGLLDLVEALATGHQPHCNARRALHHLAVLEAMSSAITSSSVQPVSHAPPPARSLAAGSYAAMRRRFGLIVKDVA